MVTGVSLSHSRGLGNYAGVDTGRLTSAVTGLYPWIGYKASERVTVWTVAGYGAGGLMLNPGAGAPIETGLSMAMAAGGGRGQILGGGDGFGLAFKADTLWVGTRTKAATGPGGNLDSTKAAVSRMRTAIRRVAKHHGGQPDGPDAERGDRHPPGRRRRRNRTRHGPGGRPRARGRRDRARRRHPGAEAPGPPGRRLRRERHVDLGQLQPDAEHAAGLHRTRVPPPGAATR